MVRRRKRRFFYCKDFAQDGEQPLPNSRKCFWGQLSSYIERHLLSLSRTKNEEKGISQNGIHDIMRKTLIQSNSAIQSVCP